MGTIPVFIVSLLFVAAVAELLRRKRLREKFAVLWLVIGLATIVLAGFPQLLEFASSSVGVKVPANLLFTMAIILLMGVCLHLSLTLTKVEDQTRVLAEEVALLRYQTRLNGLSTEPLNHGPVPSPKDETDGESGR